MTLTGDRAAVSDPISLGEPAARALTEPGRLDQILAKGPLRATLIMLGPAFVAAVAYVDPGNFATNIQGGAEFGYLLLWVVLLANVMAMQIQYLSAKLGIVTDRDLPQLCREHLGSSAGWVLWVQAEVMAMSTDVAEFVGAALGLNLLFGVPMVVAGAMTALIALAMLHLQTQGYRRFEIAISAFLGIVLLGFLYETLRVGPNVRQSLSGLVPHLAGNRSMLLAAGIVGATVMPHAIYLHSALTSGRVQCRNDRDRSTVLRFERIDVLVALGLAGLVNMAMLAVAAKLFHRGGHALVQTIQEAHAGFATEAGGAAALAFAVALLASGSSSSSVGTYAGQVVMRGFVNLSIPVVLRRAVTMAPAIVVLAIGFNPTDALVLSQVLLSFGIPFALVPLIVFTRDPTIMGPHVNHRSTTMIAVVFAVVITALNLLVLYRLLWP